MKKVILVLMIILVGCKEEKKTSEFPTELNKVERISIEFPELSNWKELYSNPNVKNYFDEFSRSTSTNLGVYLENELSKKTDSLEDLDFDNFAVFYTIDKEQKNKTQNYHLKNIFNYHMKKKLEKRIDTNELINKAFSDTTYIKPNKNYLLDIIQDHKNVHTGIMVLKPFEDDHKIITIMSYNLINIKNHLIYAVYYYDFNGTKTSINKAIENNKIIISEFVKKNKHN